MNTINYSIIIPHKNNPDLLQRCLNSIPRRTDIQIIVVDDDSDLNMVDFDHFPGSNDSFVEVIYTKEGKGAGYARNIGIEHAKGKWLLFADADDFYLDGFLDILDAYKNKEYDIIYFNFDCINEKNEKTDIHISTIFNEHLNGRKTDEDIKFSIWVPWNKMFSSSFINKFGLKFEEIPVGNDALFSLKASEYSLNNTIIKNKLYCYAINSNSITFRKRDFKRDLLYLDVNIRINHFLKKNNHKKQQMVILTPSVIINQIRYYGIGKTIKFLFHLAKKDSLLSNIALYLSHKFKLN